MESPVAEADGISRQAVVLLVEDEFLLLCTTAEFLRTSGYDVVETTNAADAVAVLGSGKPVDVVFSDIGQSAMMDGLMFARWLHQWRPDVPVILTSGYGDSVRQAAAELVGNESFLPKPYHPEEVTHRIRALLKEAGLPKP